jgi:hypothetical protein
MRYLLKILSIYNIYFSKLVKLFKTSVDSIFKKDLIKDITPNIIYISLVKENLIKYKPYNIYIGYSYLISNIINIK